MTDAECVAFLQWALPRLGLRWPGFRKVRKQVCKRVRRRMHYLGLESVGEYRRYLEDREVTDPEWRELDAFCRITISRFHRDRGVYDCLAGDVMPALADGALRADRTVLWAWSAGCGAGEEPYSLSILWEMALAPRFPGLACRVVATDTDAELLDRARRGCYPGSSLKELPPEWRRRAFEETPDGYRLRPAFRGRVEFRRQDARGEMPDGAFDLILCRNLVFTYFEEPLQRELLPRFTERLRPGGAFLIGAHERLPAENEVLVPWSEAHGLYRRVAEAR